MPSKPNEGGPNERVNAAGVVAEHAQNIGRNSKGFFLADGVGIQEGLLDSA
jgi:hypothetical protein